MQSDVGKKKEKIVTLKVNGSNIDSSIVDEDKEIALMMNLFKNFMKRK